MEPVAFSIPEVLERFPIGRSSLYELIRAGEIASIKVRGRRLIPASALEEYIARLRAEQA